MQYVGNIEYDEYLLEDKKYIIYGAGVFGKKIYGYLKERGKEKNILFFCDKKSYGKTLFGIKVVHPIDAINISDVEFLVAGKYEHEMVHFLFSHGIKKIHLLSI